MNEFEFNNRVAWLLAQLGAGRITKTHALCMIGQWKKELAA